MKEYLLSLVTVLVFWFLILLIGFSGSFNGLYFGIRISNFISVSTALTLSSVTSLMLTIAHKNRQKTLRIGCIANLICVLLPIAIGYGTLDLGWLHPHINSDVPRQEIYDLVGKTLFFHCVGVLFGVANGWIFRKIPRGKSHSLCSLTKLFAAFATTLIWTINSYGRISFGVDEAIIFEAIIFFIPIVYIGILVSLHSHLFRSL
jgi:hypothetical protein